MEREGKRILKSANKVEAHKVEAHIKRKVEAHIKRKVEAHIKKGAHTVGVHKRKRINIENIKHVNSNERVSTSNALALPTR